MKRALVAIWLSVVAMLAATPAVAAGDPPPMKATPALWYVHGPAGNAYLLGSIHALPKNVNWQTPEIVAAIKKADTFVFELKMDDDNKAHISALFSHNGLLPITEALPNFFDQEMRDDYRNVLIQTGADPSHIVYMRPWLAALVLEGSADGGADFHAAEGVDNRVYAIAKARGVKNFRAFETDELQMGVLMGNHTPGDEVEQLRATFKKILSEHNQATVQDLLHAWARGDAKALAKLGPDSPEMSPEEKKTLLDNRNRAWIPQIVAMLKEKHTYFVTVGAAHLVGKGGVPNLLRAAGYKVDGP